MPFLERVTEEDVLGGNIQCCVVCINRYKGREVSFYLILYIWRYNT